MSKRKLYAFWRHTTTPFVHWGEVEKIHEDGSVEIVGMANFCFHPITILSQDAGEKAGAEIDHLIMLYHTKAEQLKSKYRDACLNVIDAK